MNRARTVGLNPGQMLSGAVANVPIESVGRILLGRSPAHQAVTHRLSDDRCGGHGSAQAISSDKRVVGRGLGPQ